MLIAFPFVAMLGQKLLFESHTAVRLHRHTVVERIGLDRRVRPAADKRSFHERDVRGYRLQRNGGSDFDHGTSRPIICG